jgi:hypothetical protein
VRYTETSDLNFLSPSAYEGDVAVLFGKRRSGEKAWARIAGGAGIVTAVRPGPARDCWLFFCDYDISKERAVGLALQGDAVWTPFSGVGLGVSAIGNVNPTQSFALLTFGVYVGKLR